MISVFKNKNPKTFFYFQQNTLVKYGVNVKEFVIDFKKNHFFEKIQGNILELNKYRKLGDLTFYNKSHAASLLTLNKDVVIVQNATSKQMLGNTGECSLLAVGTKEDLINKKMQWLTPETLVINASLLKTKGLNLLKTPQKAFEAINDASKSHGLISTYNFLFQSTEILVLTIVDSRYEYIKMSMEEFTQFMKITKGQTDIINLIKDMCLQCETLKTYNLEKKALLFIYKEVLIKEKNTVLISTKEDKQLFLIKGKEGETLDLDVLSDVIATF